jgi:uncharacterized repeat protein (TIGR04052 family)
MVASALPPACSSHHGDESRATDAVTTGTVSLNLIAADGTEIRRVDYVVTNQSGATVTSSFIDAADPKATFSLRLTLPAGNGYAIRLSAQTTQGIGCQGSATFNVVAGATQQVSVDLLCEGENDGNNTGDVVVDGQIVSRPGTACPDVAFLSASPLQTSVGAAISLFAGATGSAAGVSVGWTASAGAVANPNVADTTYTCTAVGTVTLTFAVTQGQSCRDSESVQVTCVAATPSADAGTAADGGSPDDAGASDAGVSDGSSGTDAETDLDAGPPAPRAVTIRFKAEVSGQDFACGQTYANQGSTSVSATPSDLRFFVQDLRLINSAGEDVPVSVATRSPWQMPEVALVDFENGQGACVNGNPETNVEITGTVPAGTYTGVAFRNGIPPALNHGNPATAPAPLSNAPGTLWTWLSGYKFILAELSQVVGAGQIPGLGLVHIGSTACSGNPQQGTVTCARPNRNEVRLANFNPDTNVVVVDLGTIHAQTDISQDAQCHSSGTFCAAPFASLGVDFATGQALATQTAFHVE